MMKKKIILDFALLILVITLFSSLVSSFGVAPSSYTYDYVPNQAKQLSLRVLNFDNDDLLVSFDVDSDSSDIDVVFNEDVVSLLPAEREKSVSYTLYLGDDPKPGVHDIDIKLVQFPNGRAKLSSNSIDVTSIVIQKVHIFVPYDGAYLVGDLFAKTGDVGDPLTFVTQFVNKGTQETVVTGYIAILDPLGNEIARVTLPSKNMDSLEKYSTQSIYSGLKIPGYYISKAHLFYDDKELVLEDSFLIGDSNLEVVSLSFNKFKLGEITKLSFDVENSWNKDIGDVYADISVVDDSGNFISEFRTTSASVSAYGIGRLTGYWDTTSLIAGPYRLLLNLNYDDKVGEQTFDILVGLNTVNLVNNDISGNVAGNGSGSGFTRTGFLILLVLVILGINVFILLKINKKK